MTPEQKYVVSIAAIALVAIALRLAGWDKVAIVVAGVSWLVLNAVLLPKVMDGIE